jgi:protein-S-isoprenylcysteine O-methyltransferase Ste14
MTLELRVPPVVVMLVAGLAMWLLDRLVPGPGGLVRLRAVVALALLAVGVAIVLAGVREFRRASTTVNPLKPAGASAMVRSGIYGHSRNPMYLGMLLALGGWAAWLASPLALLGLPAFVAYLNRYQIGPEERVLAALFSEEFADYRRSVRRWL